MLSASSRRAPAPTTEPPPLLLEEEDKEDRTARVAPGVGARATSQMPEKNLSSCLIFVYIFDVLLLSTRIEDFSSRVKDFSLFRPLFYYTHGWMDDDKYYVRRFIKKSIEKLRFLQGTNLPAQSRDFHQKRERVFAKVFFRRGD